MNICLIPDTVFKWQTLQHENIFTCENWITLNEFLFHTNQVHSNDLQNEVICKVTVCLLVAAWLPCYETSEIQISQVGQRSGCVPLRLGIRVPSVLPCWARLETTFQQHSHQLNRGQVPVQACAEIFIVGRAEHARPVSGISFIRRKRVERRPLGWSLRYSARAAGLLHQQQDDSMSSRKYDDIEVLGTLDPHSCLSTSSFALFGHSGVRPCDPRR